MAKTILGDFLSNSWSCIETLVRELSVFHGDEKRKPQMFYLKNGKKYEFTLDGRHFFLRSSVEYSNPQLTVEEVQGIIGTRLLEVCANYFHTVGLHEPDSRDISEICEKLNKPSEELVVSFLLNTDETEPDRYSMNPLKESIVKSGQSAFPSASVKTEELKIDDKFMQKYEKSLISRSEAELISRQIETCNNSYIDMVDAVKYEQMENLSTSFGINLTLCSMRMPLIILRNEKTDDLLHCIIKTIHTDYRSIETAYNCMGRSMKNRTTLLTIPHSKKGYGSKRAARGKIYFDGTRLKSVKVGYRTTPLYPNAIDPEDVSVAEADDSFTVEGDKLTNYSFGETPSSPQFFVYSLGSPESAVIWHGIGAFGAAQMLKSYAAIRVVCETNPLFRNLKEQFAILVRIPLQFNLMPKHMWFHPIHRNIDASIGCIDNLQDLAKLGMRLENLIDVSGGIEMRKTD